MNTPIEAARRRPSQARSQATVDKILSAASALLGQGKGVGVLTTAAIAKRAGVSVGGLYRFFSDKQEIIDAIALSYMERFTAELPQAVAVAAPRDGRDFLGAVIDAFVAFLEAHPDFRTIAYGEGGAISGATRSEQASAEGGGSFLRHFMTEALGINAGPALDFKIRIAAEAGDRLIGHAFTTEDRAERGRIVAETKQMLALYLFDG